MSEQVVKDIFSTVLELDAAIDWSAVQYQQTPGWDSVAHMAIVAELEERLGIMLDTDDVVEMSSYAVALEILKKHGVSLG